MRVPARNFALTSKNSSSTSSLGEVLTVGCAPSPYTERIATYRLALEDGAVMLDPTPNAPGTYIEPLRIIEATR